MPNSLARQVGVLAVLAALIIAGCGGGGQVASPVSGGGGGEVASPVNGGGSDPAAGDQQAGGQGGSTVGAPTLSADPGSAWAEVDGTRLEYMSSGGVAYECTVADDRVIINFQTPDGHDLLVQGAPQADGWILNLNFKPGRGDKVTYGTTSTRGDGTFGVGDGAISYEGKVDRIEGVDIANATKVDARVAVNCASAGGDPTATIGGQTYVFALSGAQSVTCEVAPDRVTVRINRLALDGEQLEIDGRQEGDKWIGAIAVTTNDGTLVSPMAPDGTGLTLDGSNVEYAGAFKTPDGSTLDGTASVTCP